MVLLPTFLVYVDELLVTSSTPQFTATFVHALAHHFSTNDLGSLHYFLVVEVVPTSTGLFLCQHKYIRDLLERHQLDGMKEATTPMSFTGKLSLVDGSPPTDASLYRSVIDSLQYLQLTRPDIGFAVNKLAQFMHAPTQSHWCATKRLLRYLKSIIYFGINLLRHQPLTLVAYSNAEWAGDHDNFTSTSAYVVFLGSTQVSRCSKKQHTIAVFNGS